MQRKPSSFGSKSQSRVWGIRRHGRASVRAAAEPRIEPSSALVGTAKNYPAAAEIEF